MIARFIAGALLLSSVFCAQTSYADGLSMDQAAQDPLSIEISLLTPASTMIGRPIILHYSMRYHGGGETIATQPDRNSNLWYTLELDGPEGEVSRWAAGPGPLRLPEHQGIPVHIFTERSTLDGDIAVNSAFPITKPGSYTLVVHTNMQYADLGPSVMPPENWLALVKASGRAIRKDTTFHLIFTAPEPAVLQPFAMSLYRKIAEEKDAKAKAFLLDELFAMPDEYAAGAWRALGFDASIPSRMLIARRLAGTQSLKAVDILVAIEFDAPIAFYNGAPASVLPLLVQMSNEGSPEMKAYIVKQLARHHVDINMVPG